MEPAPAVTPRARAFRALKLAVGFSVSALFIYALFSRTPLARVGAALSQANPAFIFAALGAVALSYVIRSQRWALMLRRLGAQVRFSDAAIPLMSCVALNNVLPFRAGDVVRIVAFRRLTKVAPSMQLGSLVLERLLDIATLMAILSVTLALNGLTGLQPRVRVGLEGVALAGIAAVVVFLAAPAPIRMVVRAVDARVPRLRRTGESLLRLSEAITALSNPLLLARLAGLSALAWLFEGSAYVAVARSLDVAHSLPAGLLALGLGTLATSIPSSPGYIGTFHYFAALALTELGTDPALAAAYAILIHALLWLSTTSAGLFLMLLAGRRPGQLTAPASPRSGIRGT